MATDDEITPRAYVLETVTRRLAECEQAITARNEDPDRYDEGTDELPHPNDVLSIDVRHTASVLLQFGGPTTSIVYVFDDEYGYVSATWETTDTPYATGHGSETLELSDNEAETFAEVYCGGLDMIAETIRRAS